MRKSGFTLVELLVVVALVAVIGAGVAVTYGQDLIDRAKTQMTVHEMGQIREAFQKFYTDNERQLFNGVYEAKRSKRREKLPSEDFRRTFIGKARDNIENSRLYGMLEFFERYGLWCLLRPAAAGKEWRDYFNAFPAFDPSLGEGWQGPYLRPVKVVVYTEDGGELVPRSQNVPERDISIPQIATRYENGIYRIVYFEHCEDENDKTKPIYRRLLLLCPSNDRILATREQLRRYVGNRRNRPNTMKTDDAFPLDPATGTILPADSTADVQIMELLNLDTWER